MDPILEMYQALEEKVLAYNPNLDRQRLQRAFQYADSHHSKQLRRDGTPYITHPLAVADILADLKMDTDSLIAALRSWLSASAPPLPIWWRALPS